MATSWYLQSSYAALQTPEPQSFQQMAEQPAALVLDMRWNSLLALPAPDIRSILGDARRRPNVALSDLSKSPSAAERGQRSRHHAR